MSLKKPSEKRFRVPSSEDEEVMHVGDEAGDAMMLKSILEKLEKLDLLEQIHERLKKIESDYKELKRQCPLTPSEIENMWHMMKNQNSPFFAQRYLMVALETWWHFLLRNYF